MSGTPNEPTGIQQFMRKLRYDRKSGQWIIPDRDMPRGFTTISFHLGATANTLYTLIGAGGVATIQASAQGVAYGLVLANNCLATGGTVSIWEGTASVRKFHVYLLAADVQEFSRREENPLFKWQPNKTLQARSSIGGKTNPVTINLAYWQEEP